jgi:serine protease AprX
MRESDKRGSDRELRSSALWGTGGRGGDSRSSALWGKGGRGSIVTTVAILALAAPIAAGANGGSSGPGGDSNKNDTWVQPELKTKALTSPNEQVKVIIQSNFGEQDAETKAKAFRAVGKLGRDLNLVDGLAMQIPAKWIPVLAKLKGLTITVDNPVRQSDLPTSNSRPTSDQMWPHANGDAKLWGLNTKLPTIAVVDSGIDKTRSDFGTRVLADVNLVSNPDPLKPNVNTFPGDGRGHGTFVAGIAAGAAAGVAGAAPKANLVSVDVMNDQGMAYTSDVIAACSWILQNKALYNIKIANFSMHSSRPSNFGRDPFDKAVEKLWFGGVTVVAAAGNYGNVDGTPSGVKYAPGNDPFVITVGAVDIGQSPSIKDDSMAPWSAWGYTYDGFRKPEISAAGRYMVGPVPPSATLYTERPTKVVSNGYMELSGTSFSAPVVAGTAAYLLALHPSWGPDQVKGALMLSTQAVPLAQPYQGGVGQINAVGAVLVKNAPNPNAGLNKFIVPDPTGGTIPVFDEVSWYNAAKADPAWNAVSWADALWSAVSWSSVSWSSISWTSVSWLDVSWSSVSWSSVSWADVSWLDNAKEEALAAAPPSGGVGIPLDPAAAAAIAADPALALDLGALALLIP